MTLSLAGSDCVAGAALSRSAVHAGTRAAFPPLPPGRSGTTGSARLRNASRALKFLRAPGQDQRADRGTNDTTAIARGERAPFRAARAADSPRLSQICRHARNPEAICNTLKRRAEKSATVRDREKRRQKGGKERGHWRSRVSKTARDPSPLPRRYSANESRLARPSFARNAATNGRASFREGGCRFSHRLAKGIKFDGEA